MRTTHSFVPIVCTTAELVACSFDPADVDAGSGELPLDRTKLAKAEALWLRYPLPVHLQPMPANASALVDDALFQLFKYLPVLVVQSRPLSRVLADLEGSNDRRDQVFEFVSAPPEATLRIFEFNG